MLTSRNYLHLPAARALIVYSALAITLGLAACKSSPPPADDATLTAAVQSRLAGDGALSTESIQSSVQNAVATLNGNVSSEAARSLATADAAQVAGIKTVVNNLAVQQPQQPAIAAVTPPQAPIPTIPKKTPPTQRMKPVPVVRQQPAPAAEDTAQAAAPPPPPPAEPAPPPPPQPSLPPAPPPPPPVPAFRNITIPVDTSLPIRITQTLDSATTQQGDSFTGVLATDVILDNLVVLRQGTPVSGRVSAVQEAAHYKGSSLLTVELTSINQRGERLPITTDSYSVKGKGRGANTAEKVGGGAAVGAVLGGILGGGKGAAIGAAAGGGVGAGANTITRGEQVQITSETLIRFQLNSPLLVRVSTRSGEGPTTAPDLQQRPANQPPQ
jgi:BON domain